MANATTQSFTEIIDIKETVVIFAGNMACSVIEVSSSNFALLSVEEQDAKVGAYASFVNSLAFPVQILVNNRRVDISSYVALLEGEINKIANPKVAEYMQGYKEFVKELVKQNIVLDKRFYIVVPYSLLESGAVGTVRAGANMSSQEGFFTSARAALNTKADSIRNQLGRINLQTKVLEQDELVKLFQSMYNPEAQSETHSAEIPIPGGHK